MDYWIRLGGTTGVPLEAIVPAVGDLEVTHEWPGGSTAMTFSVLMPPTERPPQIIEHARCDLMIGARPVWCGYLSEINRDTNVLTAKGAITEGDSTPVLDAGGLTTTIPDTAIDSAINRGELTWTRPASLRSTAMFADGETVQVNYLTDLLNEMSTELDTRVYVDPHRALRMVDDPTVPAYYLLPGTPDLSPSTQAQATRLIGRYQSTAAGALTNVTVTAEGAKPPYVVRTIDMTKRGLLDSTRATNILDGILKDVSAGGWAGGIEVTQDQIAGNPDLSQVAEACGRGAMFRKLGQRDPRPRRGGVGVIDFLCGQSIWRPADRAILLSPIGTVARDLNTALAENNLEEAA